MASAIGIRIYQISVTRNGKTQPLTSGRPSFGEFISDYISSHTTSIQDSERERSWHLELKEDNNPNSYKGYIHYGTYGFESDFVDAKSKKHHYRRKRTDVEIIPLYFEFWLPENEHFGFAAFQSFQGRSCINLIMTDLKNKFEKKHADDLLSFKKLLPADSKNGLFASAPVKQFRLIRRDAPSDLADRYFSNPEPDSVKFEVIMSARRNKSLGNFGNLSKSIKLKSKNVVRYGGVDFPEAVAEIRIGNRTRKVGVFGLNGEAGVIDITDSITRGPDGHPTFASIALETDSIIDDMYKTMKGYQK